MTDRILSVGYIDHAFIAGGQLRLLGWCLSLDGARPASGRVRVDGVDFGEFDCIRQPSPDVREVFHQCESASDCRYVVDVPSASLPPGDQDDVLLELVPRFDERDGKSMYFVLNQSRVPPAEFLDLVGSGMATGFETLGLLVSVAGLEPGHSLLDIGCGTGRSAIPYALFKSPDARYVGFDVVAPMIEWAKEHVADDSMEFVHIDISNGLYNQSGIDAADVTFPCADMSVDVAFATSVFTHMFLPEIARYLAELKRVLVSGGAAYLTFFVVEQETPENERFTFVRTDDGFVTQKECPEAAIGFPMATVQALFADAGLTIESYWPGSWRKDGAVRLTAQDAFLVRS